jgi:hypothetical protein
MKNISRTTVAIGLGIIEVAGIDPQKQVCLVLISTEQFLFFNQGDYIECKS